MPISICQQCGISFKINQSAIDRGRGKYCSKSCLYQFKKTITGPINPGWTRIEFICKVCNKTFYRTPSSTKKGCGVYCSMQCRKIDRVKLICETCGGDFYKLNSEISTIGYGRFCSKSCYRIYRKTLTGDMNCHWKGGRINYYGPNWRSQKDKARKRDKFTCQVCGITESIILEKLSVHHITPFRKYNGNWKEANDLVNLISVCRSCHLSIEPRIIPIPADGQPAMYNSYS